MCGIAGFIDFARQHPLDDMLATVGRMAETLSHRGPDDSGVWGDAETGVALGHRRLSIVDLSPAGHQPMLSAGGRYLIVFNGEVYNHREIRAELESLSPDGYSAMIASTTQLNTPGIALGRLPSVHALTDVTGFGLLGHLLEICRGSGAGATLDFARIPLHPGTLDLARAGLVTGASARNWAGYGPDVDLGSGIGDAEQAMLTDPQTSGGLLVACAPEAASEVLTLFRDQGFAQAAEIGEITAAPPRVTVL